MVVLYVDGADLLFGNAPVMYSSELTEKSWAVPLHHSTDLMYRFFRRVFDDCFT